ncbi:hypothetical protein KF840_12915 [bacterium]|nr:hypothetical protein [bacterium]
MAFPSGSHYPRPRSEASTTAYVERTLELRGTAGLGQKPRPELLGPILGRIHSTLLDSVRMGFLHSSRMRGAVPKALRRASEVRYLGHSAASGECTALHFELPEFGSVAEELFRQGQLWDSRPRPDETAIDLLAQIIGDVRGEVRDSQRFDQALLGRLARYRPVFRRGLTAVALVDARAPSLAEIDAPLSRVAQTLARDTPPARRVRLCARLDMLGVSKRVLGLLPESGTPVTAVWIADDFVDLARFLDQQVLIEGLAEFRPSGALLRIDADAIRPAAPADRFFAQLPVGERRRNYAREAAATRPGERPYASIIGLLPADESESEEEFSRAVDELS